MPQYKSVAFPDHKPVAVKFGDELASPLEGISSADVRAALGAETYSAAEAEADRRGVSVHALLQATFIGIAEERTRRTLRPYAGWPAGEERAAAEASGILESSRAQSFLDPFAGRANYAALAAQHGLRAWFCEVSPVYQRVAEARLSALFVREEARRPIEERLTRFARYGVEVAERAAADRLLESTRGEYVDEVTASRRADVERALDYLQRLRVAVDDEEDPIAASVIEAALVEALPRTTGELELHALKRALQRELAAAVEFVRNERALQTRPQLIASDVRTLRDFPPLGIGLVITNPPSLNFVSYMLPVAAWFLGLRRPRVRRSPETEEALRTLRRFVDARTARAVVRSVERVSNADARMGRISANYFAMMAASFAAILPHLTPRCTIVLEMGEGSTLAGVPVPTRKHLESMLAGHGFARDGATTERVLVIERG